MDAYNNSDDEDYQYDYDDNDSDGDYLDSSDVYSVDVQEPKKNYIIIKEAEIKKTQEDDITNVCNVLSIPRNVATILLHYYNWTRSQLFDNWLSDEEKVRKQVGLLSLLSKQEEEKISRSYSKGKNISCEICFDSFTKKGCVSTFCGHLFCRKCYLSHIKVKIDDGVECLRLRCPQPGCKVIVDPDLIRSIRGLSDKYKNKYDRFLLRSYVEQSKKLKWCPGNDCDNAVKFDKVAEFVTNKLHCQNFDVVCNCSCEFCWNCHEEMHSPVDCETVKKWERKNKCESENMNWVLAYTKSCPKCKNPIEKNQGCMHMTCRAPCKHQFCWLCLGDWGNHGGSGYTCNAYEQNKGKETEEDRKRKNAKSLIERYAHYYERWENNGTSRIQARKELNKVQNCHKLKLYEMYRETETLLKAIEEAWIQIIECRRVLRWSYAYGYYLPEEDSAKKTLFEYLQSEAESNLERLHHCAETELLPFLEYEIATGEEQKPNDDQKSDVEFSEKNTQFVKYCTKLKNLTKVTKTFFQNLSTGLQNGLEAVDSSGKMGKTNKKSKT